MPQWLVATLDDLLLQVAEKMKAGFEVAGMWHRGVLSQRHCFSDNFRHATPEELYVAVRDATMRRHRLSQWSEDWGKEKEIEHTTTVVALKENFERQIKERDAAIVSLKGHITALRNH